MRKSLLILVSLLVVSSTSYAELQTEVIRHWDGSATINQWDPEDGYSYSEDVPANKPIVIPTEKIIMTKEEAQQLRDTDENDPVKEWQRQNQIIEVR